MTELTQHREQRTMNMMYGTYADVLFVLFPFMVIFMQRLWDGELADVLLRPDLSIAAAILGGLAIGKFVLGLVTERDLGPYKERIVFFIAVTMLVVLGPATILLISIVGGSEVPAFVAFIQPLLLIIAISLYTTAISISNMLTSTGSNSALSHTERAVADEHTDLDAVKPNEPLVIPRRSGRNSD